MFYAPSLGLPARTVGLGGGILLEWMCSPAACQDNEPLIAEALEKTVQLAPSNFRKGLKMMMMLIAWEIWKERNACVFNNKLPHADDMLHAIRNTLELWRLAGARCLEPPFGEYVGRE